MGNHHGAAAADIGTLVAGGGERDRQDGDINEQDKLHAQQGKALKVVQTEIAFGPGKVTFNRGAGTDHQALPLFLEEAGGNSALALAAPIVVDRRMGMEDVMDNREHAPIKVSVISIDHLYAEAKQQRSDQHHKPTDLGGVRMGGGQQ